MRINRDQASNDYLDGEDTPDTSLVRHDLFDNAKTMLADFLRKSRASRRKGGGSRGADSRKIDIVCVIPHIAGRDVTSLRGR